MAMTLQSSDFAPGGPIPPLHTCEGEDLSPELHWSEVPAGTRSLALVVDDPDARSGTYVHWIVFGLDPASTGLLVVAIATSPLGSHTNMLDMITDFTRYLPPGSRQIVSEFLIHRAPQVWKWAVLGWAGTLIAGSQVMKLIMEGIHIIYGDAEKPGFLHRQWRGCSCCLPRSHL